ncbi:MAG: DsrE family protein [Methylotenera sp.]|nr:DsrE family protein [Oligoflexia bacterium]
MGLKNVKAMLAESQAQHTLGEIRVVTLGPALKLFTLHPATPLSVDSEKIAEELRSNEHVRFFSCENTMKAFGLKLTDLRPGFQGVPSGAYEVVRLQRDGFQYYKP